MKRRALILALAVLPVLAAVGAAVAAGAFDGPKNSTARFHDIEKAKEAGYTVKVIDQAGLQCIAQPGEGAMGIHMLNPSLLDGTIDADKPELLVYERRNDGSMKLVALEYLIFQSASERQAVPVRPAVRRDQGRQPLWHSAVLGAARLDLEAESERHALRLEPAGRLRSRSRVVSSG